MAGLPWPQQPFYQLWVQPDQRSIFLLILIVVFLIPVPVPVPLPPTQEVAKIQLQFFWTFAKMLFLVVLLIFLIFLIFVIQFPKPVPLPIPPPEK